MEATLILHFKSSQGGQHNIELPDAFYHRLQEMFHFIVAITDQRGHVPAYGDNDSSSLLQYEFDRLGDFSYLEVFGSYLFEGEGDFNTTQYNNRFLMLFPVFLLLWLNN